MILCACPAQKQTIPIYIFREAGLSSASQERAHRTWGTQTRQWSSLASLSKYSNDHKKKAIPFWTQQYFLASEGSHRSLFSGCSVWAAWVKEESPGREEIGSFSVAHLPSQHAWRVHTNNATETLEEAWPGAVYDNLLQQTDVKKKHLGWTGCYLQTLQVRI